MPDRRPIGRPPAIGPNNPEIADTIIQAIQGRQRPEAAAAMAGISKEALYDALRRGRRCLDGRLPKGTKRTRDLRYLAQFSDRYALALAQAEVQTLALIGAAGTMTNRETRTTRKHIGTDDAGQPVYAEEQTVIERPPDVSNLRWIAERRWPEWAPPQKVTVSGPDGGPIPIEVQVEALLGTWRAARREVVDTTEIGPAEAGAG